MVGSNSPSVDRAAPTAASTTENSTAEALKDVSGDSFNRASSLSGRNRVKRASTSRKRDSTPSRAWRAAAALRRSATTIAVTSVLIAKKVRANSRTLAPILGGARSEARRAGRLGLGRRYREPTTDGRRGAGPRRRDDGLRCARTGRWLQMGDGDEETGRRERGGGGHNPPSAGPPVLWSRHRSLRVWVGSTPAARLR